MARWLRRIAAAVSAGLLLVLANPVPATAVDNYLVASDPAARQELQDVPGWVTLAFRSKANAKLAKVLVLDASGKNVTTGALIVEGTNVTTQLAFDVPKGTYTVMYRTSGEDGRIRGGSFQFAYGKGDWKPLEKEVWIGEAEQPPVLANPDPNASNPPTATAPATSTASPGQPSGSSTSSTGPSAGPTTRSPAEGSAALPWVIGGVVLLVAAAGAGWFYWLRRRRS